MSEGNDILESGLSNMISVMGDAITVQHYATPAYSINALVDWPQQEPDVPGVYPRITARAADFQGPPVQGMLVTIGPRTYRCFRVIEDGSGGVKVYLNG